MRYNKHVTALVVLIYYLCLCILLQDIGVLIVVKLVKGQHEFFPHVLNPPRRPSYPYITFRMADF